MPGKPARFRNVPAESHRVLELRGERQHAENVALPQLCGHARALQLDVCCRPAVVFIHAFERRPEQGRGGRETAGKHQRLIHSSCALQLINCRDAHAAREGHLRPYGRDENHISREQRSIFRHISEQQQIVQVKMGDGLAVPPELYIAERSLNRWSSSGKQRRDQRAQGTKRVVARAAALAHHKNLDRP